MHTPQVHNHKDAHVPTAKTRHTLASAQTRTWRVKCKRDQPVNKTTPKHKHTHAHAHLCTPTLYKHPHSHTHVLTTKRGIGRIFWRITQVAYHVTVNPERFRDARNLAARASTLLRSLNFMTLDLKWRIRSDFYSTSGSRQNLTRIVVFRNYFLYRCSQHSIIQSSKSPDFERLSLRSENGPLPCQGGWGSHQCSRQPQTRSSGRLSRRRAACWHGAA